MGGFNIIGLSLLHPALIWQKSASLLVDSADRHQWSQRTFFPISSLIGRMSVPTSRLCQLIGVRSRFEERSWTEERDRGGTSSGGVHARAHTHGVGPDKWMHAHTLDRFFYRVICRALNINIGAARWALIPPPVRGLNPAACRRNLWKKVTERERMIES